MGVFMSDEKPTSTIVKLFAKERGFVNGRMVEPGQSFEFDTVGADGKPRKTPKWADTVAKPAKVKPVAGDLKPKDTQAAVKRKAEVISGSESA